ncbi:MAG: ATP-binding cassette domain-containing protein [Alphaproteobacteria bacterium]|jgi:oligopeptide/dipeptide ABC transporter ATP-binding protein|nr:ATP-binding cassette domain-containing protein [Alphaproteobacteria bacterium]MBT4085852.1 ATP-binding cassette domain-containing protein [Alphaproteobacteria bacterium]MBT4542675.1 ATP-binding cassette domain-containing protein [Alphaproteobacteria bacterium]MBT7746977.1 ATP-binding cassette domain-containing protein [Alphaproteobacteria bacterium]
MSEQAETLLDIRDLHVKFPLRSGLLMRTHATVHAVSGVSINVKRGEVLGLVGESGCGKTTLGRAVVGLAPTSGGSINFDGLELAGKDRDDVEGLAKKIQLIFQDPYSSLHPRKMVRDLVGEGLILNGIASGAEVDRLTLAMLQRVGLGVEHLYRFPHEFSGGQRQRIALARALVLHPDLIILDEPTSALDVSVQAQTLNLLKELKAELGLTYLFISHDLGVVRYMSDRIAVMYLGNIVETGPTRNVFDSPQHPYTRSLLAALPSIHPDQRKTRIVLEGDPPTPIDPPPGCPFAGRCPKVQPLCHEQKPVLAIAGPDALHLTACHDPDL